MSPEEKKTLDKIVTWINYSPRFESEIISFCQKNQLDYTPGVHNALIESKLVDDNSLILAWTEEAIRIRHRSPLQLKQALTKKRLSSELIKLAIDSIEQIWIEQSLITQINLRNLENTPSTYQKLLRRGYSYQSIKLAFENSSPTN
ncbi:RecX family transcriptional regulator [Candidatus Saccharibacteria bacterium]|nr:RecX family transcriptional regulator [Candidatus Saccharibacteria bacterium]